MPKKTYQEIVRGIRTSKDPTMYISEVITEVREELKSNDRSEKTIGLQKLMYLNLIGYQFDWAEFHVIEVMSQPLYKERRVGYLAATVLVRPDSELFILCANSLKKAFLSKNKYDVGLALDCFAMIVTPELARDLLPDITALLGSKRAFVRRKACLCLYRIYRQYPQGLEESFDKLKDLLSDEDISVQSSAVSVINELAREDANRYQTLAPTIYGLLKSCDNTWVLIKVIKLLTNLVTKEPRLAKKILEPLVNIVRTAETKSLLYEALYGVVQCLVFVSVKEGTKLAHEVKKVSELVMEKLMQFVEDTDPNLKYLGLCGLLKLVTVSPAIVAKKSYVFIHCLEDMDSTIRSKALNVIQSIANEKNLKNLVEDLIKSIHSGVENDMKEDMIACIIDMCSRDMYKSITDFSWYVSVLVDLAEIKESCQGELVARQLIDISLRVPAIRAFTVNALLPLLVDPDSVSETMQDVEIAALTQHGVSWVIGEYSNYLQQEQIVKVFSALTATSVYFLSPNIQTVVIQAILQVTMRLICAVGSGTPEAKTIEDNVVAYCECFLSSPSDEVRYRASLVRNILSSTALFGNEVVKLAEHDAHIEEEVEAMNEKRKLMTTDNEKKEESDGNTPVEELQLEGVEQSDTSETPKEETPTEETPREEAPAVLGGVQSLSELLDRLTVELLPVSNKAQRKVRIPDGLDLDEAFCEITLEKEIEPVTYITFADGPLFSYKEEVEEVEESSRKHHRKGRRHHGRNDKDAFYLDMKGEEEVEVKELSLEDVGVPVEEGEMKKEEVTPRMAVIGNDDDDDESEEVKEPVKEEKKEADVPSTSNSRRKHHHHQEEGENEKKRHHRHH